MSVPFVVWTLKETTCWVERTIQMVNYCLISLALTGVHVQNSAPRPDCHIPVPAPGVPRAQCGAVSARRSGHHRLHERLCASHQRHFRRPAPAHFFPALPFNGLDGLIHQSGVLKIERLWPFQLCQCGLQILGMVLSDIFRLLVTSG